MTDMSKMFRIANVRLPSKFVTIPLVTRKVVEGGLEIKQRQRFTDREVEDRDTMTPLEAKRLYNTYKYSYNIAERIPTNSPMHSSLKIQSKIEQCQKKLDYNINVKQLNQSKNNNIVQGVSDFKEGYKIRHPLNCVVMKENMTNLRKKQNEQNILDDCQQYSTLMSAQQIKQRCQSARCFSARK
ncbi:Hypothetical_protein [Hexamita inflata]|uniref:Hypothetical_protein n=1 Tax=Hexamita inflata TaxID=28002 RepID=A0AA86QPN7_9EUKA|nr:Hypothetical protein HINF_LOCUS47096 [Hexamita inflata]